MDYLWQNYQYRRMKSGDNSSPDNVRSYMEKEEKELRKWVKGLPSKGVADKFAKDS